MPISTVVKIAVEGPSKEHSSKLVEYDRKKPLSSFVAELCQGWTLKEDFSQYALQYSENNNRSTGKSLYVTEKNTSDVTSGTILKLTYSPGRMSQDVINDLESCKANSSTSRPKYLKQLVRLATDALFVEEFSKQSGLRALIDYLELLIEKDITIHAETSEMNLQSTNFCLHALQELISQQVSIWDLFSPNLIKQLVTYIKNLTLLKIAQPTLQSNNLQAGETTANTIMRITLNALALLETIVISTPNIESLFENVFYSEESISSIIDLVQNNVNRLDIQQNVIALLNAILNRSNQKKRVVIANIMSTKHFRSIILVSILNHHRRVQPDAETRDQTHLGSELVHQLYVLQTFLLGLHEERMLETPNSAASCCLVRDKILEIRRVAFENDLICHQGTDTSTNLRRTSQTNGVGYIEDYRQLGFMDFKNPLEDFNKTPPGLLALDMMYYFCRQHQDKFIKFVYENITRSNRESHECPFVKSSIYLTKLLSEILKINEPPTDEGKTFYPMFFTHNHPFEELFCICIQLLNKTWKEMRATAEDFDKVLRVLHQQIIHALDDAEAIISYEKFKIKLSRLNYAEITTMWQKERTNREEWESKAKSIVELREQILPDILELIKKHRLLRLVEGERFFKYSNKGQRIKDKFWFCRLSNNHKALHYGDCQENKSRPKVDELDNKLLIVDIKRLVLGRECPHMKDNKSKRSTMSLAFSLMYESDQEGALNFVASDERIFGHWTDGLNALINQEMTSEEFQKDLKMLSQIEMKMRMLQMEEADAESLNNEFGSFLVSANKEERATI